jgi:Ca-activated chloride channel homolog
MNTMKNLFLKAVILAAAFTGIFSGAVHSQTGAYSHNIHLILDGSSSMWGKVGDEYKIAVVRNAIEDLAGNLPMNTRLGLTVYGHRSVGDCEDIELIIPLSLLNKEVIRKKMEEINPAGKSPVGAAVEQVLAALRENGDTATVILISDGIETCRADPCEKVLSAKKGGLPFMLHIVGFDVGDEDVSRLECAAQAGGGMYFDARNAEELAGAINTAMELSSGKGGALFLQALSNGQLEDVLISVVQADSSRRETARARSYKIPETNPRIMPLPVGQYDITVTAVSLNGEVKKTYDSLTVAMGDTLRQEIDFEPGRLSIEVRRNGNLSDANVSVHPVGSAEIVATARTYAKNLTNPHTFDLTPGLYDLEISSVEIEGNPNVRIDSLEIKPNRKIEKVHLFESGILAIGAASKGRLIDVIVEVYSDATGKETAYGRTFELENSNPKNFELLSGVYRVVLKPVKDKDLGEKETKILIRPGMLTEKMIEF